jgi:GNAT superfamily N-acetyltransferase
MELKYNDVFFHINQWWWGRSIDIVKDNGTAIVCVKFDEKYFPKTGSIYGLSVLSTERRKGLGTKMIKHALMSCKDNGMTNKITNFELEILSKHYKAETKKFEYQIK